MSEPKAVASEVEEVVPGVWHWAIEDERIGGFIASAHAIHTDGGTVLVDPLPLLSSALERLLPVNAICLTCGSHQRSSWRYRRELGVQVYAPALVREVDEEPDVRYEEGDTLPGGLRAVSTPGAGTTQHSLLLEPASTLFGPDLFVHPPGEELDFVPDEYLHDPAEARRSARRVLELEFDVLCGGHGVPITTEPRAAIQALLERRG
jgi:glyoxylase-like metal-dependent hydrolase (beta-lactamase superfamily II)